jgi:acyl-CoA thioester hydrolase
MRGRSSVLQIKYVRPILPDRTIEVTATLMEYDPRIRIKYVIADSATGEVLTRAQTTQVTVERATNELCYETPAAFVEVVKRWRCELAVVFALAALLAS